VEVQAADGTCLVLDCGTGARQLGLALLAEGPPPIHLLLTHTHWDHIQGFPFFAPAYLPGTILDVYAAAPGLERTLEETLAGQMEHTYFPVHLSEMRAQIAIHEVGEGSFRIGGVTIHARYLNHTAPCLGYRLEAGGVNVVYATDHEPFWWGGSGVEPTERLLHPGDHRHVEWLAGADLVIHDAQYTDAEYPTKRNWGHSSVEYVTDLAVLAGVKRLALFHHDPTRTDQAVARLTQRMRRWARDHGSNLDVIAAAEGLDIELPETATPKGTAASASQVNTRRCSILLAGSDEAELAEVRRALEPDGYRFVTTRSISHLDRKLARERPDLLVLTSAPTTDSPAVLAERLRSGDSRRDLPIIILAREAGPDAARLLGLDTDIVLRPWNAPMLRARLRAWLARSAPRQPVRPVRSIRRPSSTKQPVPALFRGLPARARALFLDGARPIRLAAGEALVHEGDPASGVYLIRTGTVVVSVSGPDGRQIRLGTAGPGDTIGEMSALRGGPYNATVIALRPVVADYVPQDTFLATLATSPEAALRLLRLLAARLGTTDTRIVELAFTGLYDRVVQVLLEESGNSKRPTGVSTAALVRRTGNDPEQVRRALALLEVRGLVRANSNGVEVLDPHGLRQLINRGGVAVDEI
jgi:CRP-like cAMP-binding protein/phosphoribosyl 1,2-cyclic phosphodiesterase/CheY-like chemotaxis protein